MVEVSIFYKLEKTSGQTIRPKKIKSVAFLYLNGRLVFKLFCSFYCTLDIFSRKMKSLCYKYFFYKYAKTEVKIVRPTKLEKRPLLCHISCLSFKLLS